MLRSRRDPPALDMSRPIPKLLGLVSAKPPSIPPAKLSRMALSELRKPPSLVPPRSTLRGMRASFNSGPKYLLSPSLLMRRMSSKRSGVYFGRGHPRAPSPCGRIGLSCKPSSLILRKPPGSCPSPAPAPHSCCLRKV